MAVVALTEIEELSKEIVDDFKSDLAEALAEHVGQLRSLLGASDGTDVTLQGVLAEHAAHLRSLLDGGDGGASVTTALHAAVEELDAAIAARLTEAQTGLRAAVDQLDAAADARVSQLDGAMERQVGALNAASDERLAQLQTSADQFVERWDAEIMSPAQQRAQATSDGLVRGLLRAGILLLYLAGALGLALSLGSAADNDRLRVALLVLFVVVTFPILLSDRLADRLVGQPVRPSPESGSDSESG